MSAKLSKTTCSKNNDTEGFYLVCEWGESLYKAEFGDKRELITTKQGTLELLSSAELNSFDKALNLSLQSGKTLDKPIKVIFETNFINVRIACVSCSL
ncbi:hypothetical protein [Helicobacter equorum]|uniref:hypothetical protein n=1 Tax=Helicobacter equorum TaxID=361872 RepID=UPI000CF14CD9|nr:hypothetical protein [Helicobacter equorum]